MSRRSRKRKGESGGNKWLVAIVALVLLMVVAIGVINMMIRSYLQSDEFRVFLSEKVSDAISVDGEFKSLQWDGLAVRSSGFSAEGEEQIRMVDIQGLQTEIGLGGFWRGVWEVQGFHIRDVALEIDARSGVPPAIRKSDKPKQKESGWLPKEVEMESLKVDRMSVKALLDSGPLTVNGVRLDAEPGAGRQTYEVKLTGGDISFPSERIPRIRLDRADLKCRDGATFINRFEAGFWDRGRLEMTGEWDPGLDIRSAQGTVSGVTCQDLLSDEWAKRVRGNLTTSFEVVWLAGEPVASGHLVMKDGSLSGMRVLEILEAYLGNARFRMLTFNEAHADWRWREGQWSISNLVIQSEGLARLEGEMRVTGDNLDGNFRLGVAPGTLSMIPGAEKHVFLPGERGYRWAPVRVTGTLSDPKHDLTQRLFEAAGRRILEALPESTLETLLLGKEVIDVSTQNAVQEAIKMFNGGKGIEGDIDKAIEKGVKGLLDGILGGGL